MKTTSLELTKDSLVAVHQSGNVLMFYYHDGSFIKVTFTSHVAAMRARRQERWIYGDRDLNDHVGHLYNVVDVERGYQK